MNKVRDIIGKPANNGDWIVFQIDFELKIDRIKSIGNRYIKTNKNMSVLENSFIIINCIIRENPERFI